MLPLFLSFFIFLISGFAETNRLPFDLPEAESELIAGYHTEYSAMKFSFFFIAEYANVVTVCAMVTTLFFGGWDIPVTTGTSRAGCSRRSRPAAFFFLKVMFWIFFVMWIRWTLPRFRYDQLMALGWKVLMPLALAYIMVDLRGDLRASSTWPGITDPELRGARPVRGERRDRRCWSSGCSTAASSSRAPTARQQAFKARAQRATVTG